MMASRGSPAGAVWMIIASLRAFHRAPARLAQVRRCAIPQRRVEVATTPARNDPSRVRSVAQATRLEPWAASARDPRAARSPSTRQLRKLPRHARHHACPIAGLRLAELPQRRIPRAVLALEQPTPLGIEPIEHPDRLGERAREVNDRG